MATEELFQFADEDPLTSSTLVPEASLWKVLVIDDEEEVHSVTHMVLSDFEFAGRGVKLISAHSASEAEAILREQHDIAVALVDVVMETDDAGLKLVRTIRETLNNSKTRLVLRTGQPGQAPEEQVIVDYDINDYKDKTELTSIKLKTLLYSSLRSYRDIVALDNNRRGLKQVIESSATIFELQSLRRFFSAALMQLTSLLDLRSDAAYVKLAKGFAATSVEDHFEVMAGTGDYANLSCGETLKNLPLNVIKALCEANSARSNVYSEHYIVIFFESTQGARNLLYIENFSPLTETDKQLVEIFCTNASIAFENVSLKTEIEDTQRETVCLLGEAVENRSKETGSHVQRVAEISSFLGQLVGLSEQESDILRAAAPLHDLGKIGISDVILNKAGKHTPGEMAVMRQHVSIGYEMLKRSSRPVLQCAAIVAQQHHEKWDGTGYPQGLAGEDIDIRGRIVAVADVFDALSSRRCYKKEWPLHDVIEYFNKQRGTQFDPNLVDLLIANIDDVVAIRARYQD